MKFSLHKDQAKKAIGYVYSVTNEALVLVGASAEHNKVIIESASNGIYARVDLAVDVQETGIVAVDGQHLAAVKFPTDVTFVASKNGDGAPAKLEFKSGSLRGEIAAAQGGGYIKANRPAKLDADAVVRVPKDLLLKAMSASVFASPIKGATDGVCLKVTSDGLVMHTFDGIRASLYVSPLPEQPETTFQAVMTPKFFEALKKIPGNGDIDLVVYGGALRVHTDSAFLCYPQLQVEPYDVHHSIHGVLQQQCLGSFRISAKKLLDTVSTVTSVVRGGADYDTRLQFDLHSTPDPKLSIQLHSDHGDAVESVLLEGEVQPCTFCVGAKHMLEILDMVSGEVTVMVYDSCLVLQSDEGKSMLLVSTLA